MRGVKMVVKVDMVGVAVGGLKVVSFSHNKGGRNYWNCICHCGAECLHYTGKLRQCLKKNLRLGCGCIRGSRKGDQGHGLSNTPMYARWSHMNGRCYDINGIQYQDYGGRGIKVCDRWKGPDIQGLLNFIEDMGECPEGLSLERVNVNGNYCPENCIWDNRSNQGFNRRPNYNSKTGIAGVLYVKQNSHSPWIARIKFMRELIYLGSFSNLFDAVCARKVAELLYFPTKRLENNC